MLFKKKLKSKTALDKPSFSKNYSPLSLQAAAQPQPDKKSFFKTTNWILILNIVIVGALLIFIIVSSISRLSFFEQEELGVSENNDNTFKTLDRLSSADTALSLATLVGFREVSWIQTQAQNSQTLFYDNFGGLPVITKPTVINLTVRTRQDILSHVVSEDDTIASLANYFNVSQNSIRWSNDLKTNTLKAGQTLLIPPSGLNGIAYKVKKGDSLKTLAEKYNFSNDVLLSFNDLKDGEDLPLGELIFLPQASLIRETPTTTDVTQTVASTDVLRDLLPKSSQCIGCRAVKAGEVIGKNGNTGWSTGPHLHIEIFNKRGQHYNPWSFINQNRLVWPVRQKIKRVTQIYHSGHYGLDIGDKPGVDILAIDSGEMIYRGCLWPSSRIWSTFGVIIDHGNYYSLYIHLQAPNNPIYEDCSINRRSSYGQRSIDYTTNQ